MRMSCFRLKRSQVSEEQRPVYAGDDYEKSMDMITRAMACKSEALTTAQQQLNFAMQEIECLRAELEKERAARAGLEKDVKILGRAVQEHCLTLCEYFVGQGDTDAMQGLQELKDKEEALNSGSQLLPARRHSEEDLLALTTGVWDQLSPETVSALRHSEIDQQTVSLKPEKLRDTSVGLDRPLYQRM